MYDVLKTSFFHEKGGGRGQYATMFLTDFKKGVDFCLSIYFVFLLCDNYVVYEPM